MKYEIKASSRKKAFEEKFKVSLKFSSILHVRRVSLSMGLRLSGLEVTALMSGFPPPPSPLSLSLAKPA